MRGTQPSRDYHAWNPCPASIETGAIFFSYPRADSKFKRLAMHYKNGFLMLPNELQPRSIKKLDVFCYFPIEADTFRRNRKGCGSHKYKAVRESSECALQSIRTARQWLNHYRQACFMPRMHQCGFTFSNDPYGSNTFNSYAAATFNEAIKARNAESASFVDPNEFRVRTWSVQHTRALPIYAFFYADHKLANARYDQCDFYKTTGRVISIVKLLLLRQANEQAQFIYNAQDQGVR